MTELAHTLPTDFTDLDWKAINTARVLAADAVQKVGNGHPGTAMSLSPAAYLLFQKVMRHNPANPHWMNRDRFVLSVGHSSLTLYLQLFLGGWGLELADLEALRTYESKTPGHPEYRHTAGVETTTGPLGQGIANAVGMAMAARRERGLLDPDAAPGESVFDHQIYCFAGDGCLQEGVSGEASSLAGTQHLGNLTLLWDDNRISIEDDVQIAFTEDVLARYQAYGWHVQTVDWTGGATHPKSPQYHENLQSLLEAFEAARAITDRPSFIQLRTVIGYPLPTMQGSGKVHGAALGPEEIARVKELLGMDPTKSFDVDPQVLAHTRKLTERGQAAEAEWQIRYEGWRAANPERAALLDRMTDRSLPEGWDTDLPRYEADPKGIATRTVSGEVITSLSKRLPELWGGSADLASSNNTTPKGEPSFLPEDRQTAAVQGSPYGRVLHFGIREHAMGSTMNGILQHGGTRVYGGTFFVFADYMRPAVRLAALMKLPAIYVWTHDSIGVGEDGPTHQPVEHLTSYRAIMGLDVVRPADANETVEAWRATMQHTDRPTALILSRQNLPTFPRGTDGFAPASEVAKGGYILRDCEGRPDVILVATGSEVQLALTAQEILKVEGVNARVVSMPCREWFAEQDETYRCNVLPPEIEARVVVEAGLAQGWWDVLGPYGKPVTLEHFGASASGAKLFAEYGFTPENVAQAARESIAITKAH